MKLTERVLDRLATKREKVTAKKLDVGCIIRAQDRGNWEHVHKRPLYNSHPTEYCQLLECIEVERMKALEIAKQIIMKIKSQPFVTRQIEDMKWLEDNSFILDGEFAQFVPDQDDDAFIVMVDDAIEKLMKGAEKL